MKDSPPPSLPSKLRFLPLARSMALVSRIECESWRDALLLAAYMQVRDVAAMIGPANPIQVPFSFSFLRVVATPSATL